MSSNQNEANQLFITYTTTGGLNAAVELWNIYVVSVELKSSVENERVNETERGKKIVK